MSRPARRGRRWTLRPPTLRGRLALLTAVAVFACSTVAGIAVGLLSARVLAGRAVTDLATISSTFAQNASALPEDREQLCATVQRPTTAGVLPPSSLVDAELVRPDGSVCRPPGGPGLPAPEDLSAPGTTVIGVDVPVGTTTTGSTVVVRDVPLGDGWHMRLGRRIDDQVALLRRMREATLAFAAAAALVAFAAGRLVARAGLHTVTDLADAAEDITRTQNLGVAIRVPPGRPADDTTRLAASFNTMVRALSDSRERQKRLIADAGHELRTPLTSLRANIDLLVHSAASGRALPPGARDELLGDLQLQLEELGQLIEELTALAHERPSPRAAVRLDHVAIDAVERARRRTNHHAITADTQPWVVLDADAQMLERAVLNVLDNAIKFSPPQTTVALRLSGGRLTVDDQGPGIPPEQRPLVFDRFWRADEARAMPGSGLGLSIVADAAAVHGGTVDVEASATGGTRLILVIPGHPG